MSFLSQRPMLSGRTLDPHLRGAGDAPDTSAVAAEGRRAATGGGGRLFAARDRWCGLLMQGAITIVDGAAIPEGWTDTGQTFAGRRLIANTEAP